jgi:hypothetical protein
MQRSRQSLFSRCTLGRRLGWKWQHYGVLRYTIGDCVSGGLRRRDDYLRVFNLLLLPQAFNFLSRLRPTVARLDLGCS